MPSKTSDSKSTGKTTAGKTTTGKVVSKSDSDVHELTIPAVVVGSDETLDQNPAENPVEGAIDLPDAGGPSVANAIAAQETPAELVGNPPSGQDHTYTPSGNTARIDSFVYNNVQYFLPKNSNVQVDDGRLNDPAVITWLMNESDVRAERSEHVVRPNGVILG